MILHCFNSSLSLPSHYRRLPAPITLADSLRRWSGKPEANRTLAHVDSSNCTPFSYAESRISIVRNMHSLQSSDYPPNNQKKTTDHKDDGTINLDDGITCHHPVHVVSVDASIKGSFFFTQVRGQIPNRKWKIRWERDKMSWKINKLGWCHCPGADWLCHRKETRLTDCMGSFFLNIFHQRVHSRLELCIKCLPLPQRWLVGGNPEMEISTQCNLKINRKNSKSINNWTSIESMLKLHKM